MLNLDQNGKMKIKKWEMLELLNQLKKNNKKKIFLVNIMN